MKKFLFAIAALCMAHTASAQILDFEGMPPYKLGITAGINVSSFSAAGYDYAAGVQAGFDLMIDASDIFENTHLRTQLKYSMKGAKGPDIRIVDENSNSTETSYSTYNVYFTTHYIEIPVHVGYSWRLDDDWTIVADTGPYFAVGLGGFGREEGKAFPKHLSFFKKYDAHRFDFGWGVQAGLLFSQELMLNVSYDWGFKNITPEFLQNTNFAVGLTYFIE